MKLNRLEFALMNNPVRAWSQSRLETPQMIGPSGSLKGMRVMEIGCGRGVGIQVLSERMQAAEVVAFDIDPEMVALARKRAARFGHRVTVFVGDAEHIDAPDASFDAVIDYGILHHVPDWQGGLGEIARVLRPGGVFYFEEILRGFTSAPLIVRLFDHPQVSQFTGSEFRAAVAKVGLRLEYWRQAGEVGLVGRARRTAASQELIVDGVDRAETRITGK